MGGLVDLFKDVGTTWGAARAAKKDRKAAEEDRKQRMAMINNMDFEPMYASQTTPTFQRTQSPVARSYLESFLMGNNADSTFSGSPNAAAKKGVQQRAQNQTFGTPEARAQQQQQILKETPWAVQAPTRPVVGEQSQSASFVAQYPAMATLGIDSEEKYQKALASGVFNGMGPRYDAGTRPDQISPTALSFLKDPDNKAERKKRSALDAALKGG